jgi:hypothetical protein
MMKRVSSGILLIGSFLIYAGTKAVNYKLYIIVFGGVLALIGLILLRKSMKKETINQQLEITEWKDRLMATGLTIPVDLNECIIKSNNYQEEKHTKFETKAHELMNRATKSGFEKSEYEDVVKSVVVFKVMIGASQLEFHSMPSKKDAKTLGFYMATKESATIYVDKNDMKNYYFDLDFI